MIKTDKHLQTTYIHRKLNDTKNSIKFEYKGKGSQT